MRCVIVPGNGCDDVYNCNWYAHAKLFLEQQDDLFDEVILEEMPDPMVARESIWLPFLVDNLGVGEDTVLIGHSSGAEAALRLLEKHRLAGCLLVSACHTDLGLESERAAGYYSRPWSWDVIRANSPWILQCHSKTDRLVPLAEGRHVAENIHSRFYELPKHSHFFTVAQIQPVLDELVKYMRAERSVAPIPTLSTSSSSATASKDDHVTEGASSGDIATDELVTMMHGVRVHSATRTANTIIYHLIEADRWVSAQASDVPYKPPTYAADGFIHATAEPSRLLVIANHFYRSVPGAFLLLMIDVSLLTSPLRWEPPAPVGAIAPPTDHGKTEGKAGSAAATVFFPHIYGGLNTDAVLAEFAVRRSEDGTFLSVDFGGAD